MPKIDVNGTTLHYHVQGKGPAIVFIHPPTLTSENFNYQYETLSDEFKVVTFDIRGHGHSAPSDEPITYPLIVEDMTRLLDALDISECFVAGYSTGTSIALEAMLTYPERYRGGILISGMSEMSDWWNRTRLKAAINASRLRARRFVSAAISWGNSDMSLTFQNLYGNAVHGDIRNIKQYYEYSLNYNCTNRLRQIKQPQLLLYGLQDKSFHRYATKLKVGLLNSQTYMLRGVSHQLPTKAPRRVNQLIRRWLHQQVGESEMHVKARRDNLPAHLPDLSQEETETPTTR